MLLSLRPSDQISTLAAAVVLSLLCLYQMTSIVLFTALNEFDNLVIGAILSSHMLPFCCR